MGVLNHTFNQIKMTSSLTNVTTLNRFILSTEHSEPGRQADLAILFSQIQLACKVVGNAIRRAGIEGLFGMAGITNVQGEDVKKLDLIANNAFVNALTNSERVCAMCSEEDADIMIVDDELSGKYVVTFDPLDGSSNLDANVSVGSIFGIFTKKSEGKCGEKSDVLQAGTEMIAAGYALYGSSTMIVLTMGNGVHGFTLDGSLGEFVLTHKDIKIKPRGKIYSVNEGNSVYWNKAVKEYVNTIKNGSESRKPYSLRYIGSMVSDVHHTLLYGGIFMYPGDSRAPNGKLRYLYEVAPMSMLVEQAGGKSSNGLGRSLERVPTQCHERTPVFLGSSEDVDELESFFKKYPEE